MNRYILYFLTALLPFAAVSCEEEPALPEPPVTDDSYGVYFPAQSGTGDVQIEPDDPRYFTFKVMRTKATDEIFVPVTIVSEDEGIFSATLIHFTRDSKTAELEVRFPKAEIGRKYVCTIKIDDERYASRWSQNPNYLKFSVSRIQWNQLKGDDGSTSGKWRDSIFHEWFSISAPHSEQDVVIEERDDMPGYYRIHDVYNATFMTKIFGSNMTSYCTSQHYTYIDATNPDKVWIPTFRTGIVLSPEYGECSIGSYVADNEDFDPSISSVYGKLEEGVITFPSGSIQLKMELIGWLNANSDGMMRVILPGYRAKDYSLSLSAGVSDGNGRLPVQVTKGTDVSCVRLAAFEGSLTESAVDALAESVAAEDPSVGKIRTVEKDATVNYDFDKTGMYTVVAVGLDVSGNLKTTEYVSFGYLNEDDDRPVVLTVGLTCSDKYAPDGLTSRNSLELYINGKDIERINVGLYEKSDWESNEAHIKADMEKTRLTKANLDLVNGSGLSLVQGHLIPGTEYILVVKAYNGYSENYFTAEQKTGGDWDARLVSYDTGDISVSNTPFSVDGYYGTYHYYATRMDKYSRSYRGDVVVSPGTGSYAGYPYVNVTGLFPYAKTKFGLKDDRLDFIYYNGYICNFGRSFDYFVWNGRYIYPMLYQMDVDGTGFYYANQIPGLCGGFVREGYIAFVTEPSFASQYGIELNGYALMGYSDSNYTAYIGSLEVVTDILLVRPSALTAGQTRFIGEEEDNEYHELMDETVTASSLDRLNQLIIRGPYNSVETAEGAVMSMVDRVSGGGPVVKNLLNQDKALNTSGSFEVRSASCRIFVDAE